MPAVPVPALAAAIAVVMALGVDDGESATLTTGPWVAWLDVPGGEMVFGLDIQPGDGETGAEWQVWLVNGEERVSVPDVVVAADRVIFDIPHYDSKIEAQMGADGRLEGEFTRRRGLDKWLRLGFHAVPSAQASTLAWQAEEAAVPRDEAALAAAIAALNGRWAVDLDSEDLISVGQFEADDDGTLAGTFLTPTGDYRYLAGRIANDGRSFRLSCLDGSHVFLFHARFTDDGGLEGDFWSGDYWHETWTAVRDETVEPPDPFGLTRWTGAVPLSELRFPDLDGQLRALDDPAFIGKARILYVFASWCPNCAEASTLMVELHDRFADDGLSVLGLAFEVTGDLERDTELVRRYRDLHGVTYPLLVGGLSKKDVASEALPVLDKVRAWPTTIFMDGQGDVRAVYSGFSGSATGAAHERLRDAFIQIVSEMLATSD